MLTTSARRKTSSSETSSMPSSPATFASAYGSWAMKRMSNGLRDGTARRRYCRCPPSRESGRQARAPCARLCRAKPGGPSRVSASLIISLPVSASMSVMIETATGRRTPSGVITSAMPALRAGVHVDRVVAHAETRHDGEPAVGRNAVLREALGQQNERIEIGELLGLEPGPWTRDRRPRRRGLGAAARDRNRGRRASRRLCGNRRTGRRERASS